MHNQKGNKIYRNLLAIGLIMILMGARGTYAGSEVTELPQMEAGKVVLSWPEFKKVLDELEALKKDREKSDEQQKEKDEPPPVDFGIEKAFYTGTVSLDKARFEGAFTINILKKGWALAPFLSMRAAIESADIETSAPAIPTVAVDDRAVGGMMVGDPKPAQLVRNQEGYALLAKGPGVFEVRTVFYLPVDLDNLVHRLTFSPLPSVMNHLSIRIPEKGVNIIEAQPSGVVTANLDQTSYETVLTEAGRLNLCWRIEKESGMVRKKHAVVHCLASIEKSVITVLAKINLKHMDALEGTEFRLPEDVEIINVASPSIDRWEVEQTGQAQVIKVTGRVDRHAEVDISISYRLRIASLPFEAVVPVVELPPVDTMDGYLGVEIIGNLDVKPQKDENGVAVPAKNLPKTLWNEAANPLQYGFEFHRNGFRPVLHVRSYQEIQTVVANVDLVDCVTHRTLAGKSVTRIRYFIRNNDRQFLSLSLPKESRIWQVFLEGKSVKPAQKENGDVLIPMMKSVSKGEELRSFVIEIAYTSEVDKLSLKGDIINELPKIDVPVNYLRWRIYLPEYYGYTKFEGPLKQVERFSDPRIDSSAGDPLIDIPTQGEAFLFEKFLVVDEMPYIKAQYGQYLGDDIFLSVTGPRRGYQGYGEKSEEVRRQVVPNLK